MDQLIQTLILWHSNLLLQSKVLRNINNSIFQCSCGKAILQSPLTSDASKTDNLYDWPMTTGTGMSVSNNKKFLVCGSDEQYHYCLYIVYSLKILQIWAHSFFSTSDLTTLTHELIPLLYSAHWLSNRMF